MPPPPTRSARASTPASSPGSPRPGTEAWAEEGAPGPLPLPLQNLLASEAHNRINASGNPEVISMPVGQILGSMNEVRPVAEVMADLVAEFEQAVARLDGIRDA